MGFRVCLYVYIFFLTSNNIFKGVIGAIDVCNIRFKPPAAQQESYIDRKLQHSIKLQGICIPQKIFTSILVGYAGSVHDSRVSIINETEVNMVDFQFVMMQITIICNCNKYIKILVFLPLITLSIDTLYK